MGFTAAGKKLKLGYDYVCSVVDDHSRCVYTEILDDETAAATAGFLARVLAGFTDAGFRVEWFMSDIHWSYSRSLALVELLEQRGIKHVFIRSGCPWRNGKWNGLTGSCKPSGPTGSPSEAIKNTLTCLPLGFATTTMNATTSPSEATSPSVDCYQPDGRVQLALGAGLPVPCPSDSSAPLALACCGV